MSDRPAWRHPLAIAAVVLLVLLAAAYWRRTSFERRIWDETRERYERMLAEAAARRHERPPLYPLPPGSEQADDGWPHYADAMRKMRGVGALAACAELVEKGAADLLPAVRKELARCRGALTDLHRGAIARRAAYPHDYSQGFNGKVLRLQEAKLLAQAGAARSILLVREGKPTAGARLLLDTLQFGRDADRGGSLICQMISLAMMEIGQNAVRQLLLGGGLDRSSRELLAGGLARLDQDWLELSRAMRIELLAYHASILNDPTLASQLGAALIYSWRYGFSNKIMMGTAAREYERYVVQLAELSGKPWDDYEKGSGRAVQQAFDGHALLKMLVPATVAIEERLRERRARLRLLRAGLGEPLSKLQDPFAAGPLRSVRDAKGVRFWSVGPDGRDDGGEGTWGKARGLDIVLRLPAGR